MEVKTILISYNRTHRKLNKLPLTGALSLFFYLLLTCIAPVFATSPRVPSYPPLFSVVKTDTSKNNNVEIRGDKMWFAPGKGIDDEMYGFQPGSRYYYSDLCRIKNESKQAIGICYRLTGGFADLYDLGGFWLEYGDSCWMQAGMDLPDPPGEVSQVEKVDLGKGERSGPINFCFSINPGLEMMNYSGEIIFYTPYSGSNGGGEASQDQKPIIKTKPSAGRPEDEITIDIHPEKPGALPGTGVVAPTLFYGIGLAMILAGIGLSFKARKK